MQRIEDLENLTRNIENKVDVISYHIKFSFIGLKPFAVGRSTVDGYVPVVHRCSFMCTIHIDMTAHTPALTISFLSVLESSGRRY